MAPYLIVNQWDTAFFVLWKIFLKMFQYKTSHGE